MRIRVVINRFNSEEEIYNDEKERNYKELLNKWQDKINFSKIVLL